MNTADIDEKVSNFHHVLTSKLDEHFPEKTIKISSLDKKWMVPKLKVFHRKHQREYFRNRRSTKWHQMKVRFKREKRKAIKTFYSIFVSELKTTYPGKWYKMAKRIGAVDQMNGGDVSVESLQHLDNQQCAREIAKKTMQQFPVNFCRSICTNYLVIYLPRSLPR